jgi:hypothetical protein
MIRGRHDWTKRFPWIVEGCTQEPAEPFRHRRMARICEACRRMCCRFYRGGYRLPPVTALAEPKLGRFLHGIRNFGAKLAFPDLPHFPTTSGGFLGTEGMMESRKLAQSSPSGKGSNSLATHFLEVQRLRNEILKAELAALAEHRAGRQDHKEATRVKRRPGGSSLHPSRDTG